MSAVIAKLLSVFTRSPQNKSSYEQEMQLRSEIAFQDIYILLVRTYEPASLKEQEEMIVRKFRKTPQTDLKSLCIKYLSDKAKFSLPNETATLIKDRLKVAGYDESKCNAVLLEFQTLENQ